MSITHRSNAEVYNEMKFVIHILVSVMAWERFSHYLPFVMRRWFPSQWASNAELWWCFLLAWKLSCRWYQTPWCSFDVTVMTRAADGLFATLIQSMSLVKLQFLAVSSWRLLTKHYSKKGQAIPSSWSSLCHFVHSEPHILFSFMDTMLCGTSTERIIIAEFH